jgi:hypothetical protein
MTQFLASIGEYNPNLILALSLVAPSVAMYAIIFVVHKLSKASWRGHWDAV